MSNNEYRPYKTTKISKWPTSIKVFILKFWTAGMVFYFIFMSLDVFKILSAHEDRWLLCGLILILLNEFFINGLIKSMEQKKEKQRKHAMFISFKYSIFANIGYTFIVLLLTILVGGVLIGWQISLSKIFMPQEAATWEPFTFGLVYYAMDTILVLLANQARKLFNRKEETTNEVQ